MSIYNADDSNQIDLNILDGSIYSDKLPVWFPKSMMSSAQWALWKLENQKNRITKVPYSAKYKGRASSTNSYSWSSFEAAQKILADCKQEYNGLAFFIHQPFIFVDIDHCINNGQMDERAKDILEALPDQYAQVSQSGTGIHIFCTGSIEKSFKNSKLNVQVYGGGRFCAMTGKAIVRAEPHDDPEGLAYVFKRYRTAKKVADGSWAAPPEPLHKDDRWIIKKAAENTPKFNDLYYGRWREAGFSSQSEADLRLCGILAFWCDRDPMCIDRIFRTSGLYRSKWQRKWANGSYKGMTIETACSGCSECYSQYVRRIRREETEANERYYTEHGDEFFWNAYNTERN